MSDRQPAQKQSAGDVRLVLMCGLPGAGKTTVARRVAEALDAVRLAPDEWLIRLGFDGYDEAAREQIERLQWELAQEFLSAGRSVILESGFWTRQDRDEKRARARELGCSVELRYLDVPLDELWQRVQRRGAEGTPSAFAVERDDLLGWAEEFETPNEEELALFDSPAAQTAEDPPGGG